MRIRHVIFSLISSTILLSNIRALQSQESNQRLELGNDSISYHKLIVNFDGSICCNAFDSLKIPETKELPYFFTEPAVYFTSYDSDTLCFCLYKLNSRENSGKNRAIPLGTIWNGIVEPGEYKIRDIDIMVRLNQSAGLYIIIGCDKRGKAVIARKIIVIR